MDSVEALIETSEAQQAPQAGKKRKINDAERLRRCRERNRVHARNTRERKKLQMGELQRRIHELQVEKASLKKIHAESSVANILISLGGPGSDQGKRKRNKRAHQLAMLVSLIHME